MADTGFSSGGGQIGREAPENFFVPPPEEGGEGGGTEFKRKGKILHHLLNEFTRKYQEKNLCPPPESLRGGGHFGCPPPELLRRGTILRGGTVPPLKLLRGGTVP